MLKEKDIQIDDDDERRKSNLMQVSINKNNVWFSIREISELYKLMPNRFSLFASSRCEIHLSFLESTKIINKNK